MEVPSQIGFARSEIPSGLYFATRLLYPSERLSRSRLVVLTPLAASLGPTSNNKSRSVRKMSRRTVARIYLNLPFSLAFEYFAQSRLPGTCHVKQENERTVENLWPAVLLGVGIYLFCASIALPLPESTNCTARSESDDALRPGIVAQYLAGRRTRPAYGQTAHILVSRELIDHS